MQRSIIAPAERVTNLRWGMAALVGALILAVSFDGVGLVLGGWTDLNRIAFVEALVVSQLPAGMLLDGFGVRGDPPVTAKPIPVNYDGPANMDHPPGFYGPVDSFVAVNTLAPTDQLETANFDGLNVSLQK